MTLVDTHAHLDDQAFAGDLEAVLARAAAAGVVRIIAVGTSVASCRRLLFLARRFPEIAVAAGIHPHDAAAATPQDVEELGAVAGEPAVVAIGETGLDFYRDFAPRAAQERLFRSHLALAQERGLSVIIHCREAYPEVLAILNEFPRVRAVFHAFSGSVEIAQECLRRGHYLSCAGPVTFRNARRPVEVARAIPSDRLLIETDAPYLTPHPHRGRRNEPAYVRLVAERLAEVRVEPLETIAAVTTANAERIFGPAHAEARV